MTSTDAITVDETEAALVAASVVPDEDGLTGYIVMPYHSYEGLASVGEPFRVYLDYDQATAAAEAHVPRRDYGDWYEIVEVFIPHG